MASRTPGTVARSLLLAAALLVPAGALTVSAGHDLPPLPSPPPAPSPPGLPNQVNYGITPSSLYMATIPPPPGTCYIYASDDNTFAVPPGSRYTGQVACGGGLQATMSVQAWLQDTFGNRVSSGSFSSGTTSPQRSDGWLGTEGTTMTGPGAVPGEDYWTTVSMSIVLPPGYWWNPADSTPGCSVSGATLQCQVQTDYLYIPGTAGGTQP